MMYKVVVSLAKGVEQYVAVKAAANDGGAMLAQVAIDAYKTGSWRFILFLLFRI